MSHDDQPKALRGTVPLAGSAQGGDKVIVHEAGLAHPPANEHQPVARSPRPLLCTRTAPHAGAPCTGRERVEGSVPGLKTIC
jgi:hypothetical protein